jgi:hypothetical protein
MARPISLAYGFAICTILIALVLSTQIPTWQDRDILLMFQGLSSPLGTAV